MADCLSVAGRDSPGAANGGRRAVVMKRFLAVLEADPDRVLHGPEICKKIGTSSRTLPRVAMKCWG
jgi:hypothetical protein